MPSTQSGMRLSTWPCVRGLPNSSPSSDWLMTPSPLVNSREEELGVSATGVRQGDPLRNLFYSLVTYTLLQQLQKATREIHNNQGKPLAISLLASNSHLSLVTAIVNDTTIFTLVRSVLRLLRYTKTPFTVSGSSPSSALPLGDLRRMKMGG